MVGNLKSKKQSGFTIIEVLIVLAIAGLIMLIVFLAVPALQRNSRNTQRKNDVQAIIGSVQEEITNNNGQLPTTIATAIANAKLGYFAASDVTGSLANAAAQTSVPSTESGVVLHNFAKCPATATAANTAAVTMDTTGVSKRSVAAVYRVETTGGYRAQCVDM